MVYVFLANGFEELEALSPIDLLRRAGIETVTVGVGGSEITAAHGVRFITDTTSDKIKLDDDLDMIVLPGGMPGTKNLEASADVQSAIDYCSENGKYISAICAAPSILGHKGLLKGKVCTCFPGFENDLEGAKHNGALVAHDGKIITAKGAGAALQFALKLVEVLTSAKTSSALADSLQTR